VKTVEESAGICGFDAHKRGKGCKRHLLVDTLGIPLSISVTEADVHDIRGAHCLLAGLKYFVPRLTKIWAEAAYRGQELADWCKMEGGWGLEVVEHAPGQRGFSIQPRRWVVERTFGWISRNRSMSKDDERRVQTSETLLQVAMIRLLIARQGRPELTLAHPRAGVTEPPRPRRASMAATTHQREGISRWVSLA
jgi:putative transposase